MGNVEDENFLGSIGSCEKLWQREIWLQIRLLLFWTWEWYLGRKVGNNVLAIWKPIWYLFSLFFWMCCWGSWLTVGILNRNQTSQTYRCGRLTVERCVNRVAHDRSLLATIVVVSPFSDCNLLSDYDKQRVYSFVTSSLWSFSRTPAWRDLYARATTLFGVFFLVQFCSMFLRWNFPHDSRKQLFGFGWQNGAKRLTLLALWQVQLPVLYFALVYIFCLLLGYSKRIHPVDGIVAIPVTWGVMRVVEKTR